MPFHKDKNKIEKALLFIRHGSYVKPAVIAAGLNYNTHLDRYHKGKKGLEPYTKYYEWFETAKNQAEVGYVETVYDSAQEGNVGAAQWYLSRTKPNRWGKKERIEVKQDNTQKIEFIGYTEAKKREKEEDKE